MIGVRKHALSNANTADLSCITHHVSFWKVEICTIVPTVAVAAPQGFCDSVNAYLFLLLICECRVPLRAFMATFWLFDLHTFSGPPTTSPPASAGPKLLEQATPGNAN